MKQSYDSYEENRRYPRVKSKLPVEITTRNGKTFKAYTHDLSPDGLQIRCNKENMLMLNPNGMELDADEDKRVKVVFSLPIGSKQKTVTVHCKVYYISISQDISKARFAIGLRFKRFERNTSKYISHYIVNEINAGLPDL